MRIDKKHIPQVVTATLDRLHEEITRASLYVSVVSSWMQAHTPKKRDLAVLFLRWKNGDIHINVSNPIARVQRLLNQWEIEALSQIWDLGWETRNPSGKRYPFIPGTPVPVREDVPAKPGVPTPEEHLPPKETTL